MIDLHCHILPALDDGAVDLDDSVAMARQADADGISQICATPHIRHDHDVAAHELVARVETVNKALAKAGVRSRVLTGGEVAAGNLSGLSDDELRLVSLGGGGRWILLEPGPGPLSEGLIEAVDALADRGFRSLVAHPERHLDAGSPALLARLVGRGALIQGTAEHFAEPGGELLAALAGRGLIHVMGSDAHSARFGRQVRLSDGIDALAKVPELAPHLGWIADTAPDAIVRGEDVTAPYPAF
jgi:protein-tyrosine phosphatase